MRKISSFLIIAATTFSIAASAQMEYFGMDAANLCEGANRVIINKQSRVPSFIFFRKDFNVAPDQIFDQLRGPLHMQEKDNWKVKGVQRDKYGFTHTRYTQTYNGFAVEDGEYIVHARNGRVETVNGMWMDAIDVPVVPVVAEADALQTAKNSLNAILFKWQVPADEAMLKRVKNDPNATYYPSGELVIVCSNNDYFKKDYHLAWKFEIATAQPIGRKCIYVDANTGSIVAVLNRLNETDVPASGTTMYSGTQNFTCDNFGAGQYRLRETARGNGIETYNALNTTNTGGAVDFTNTTATWTSTANGDNAAYDAHWGAEKTYDYYSIIHGRNGLDDAGMLMISYVHYDSGLDNAFWDGTSMSYGDGNTLFNPLVAIDVCGHEFSHGVTEFTCNLDYQDEPGAMNESFSDIMGTAIEFYAKPLTADFLIGEEITQASGTALRNMQNPNQYNDPDTYTGTNWYTGAGDNGGVHTNSGVRNHWFYIECQGETGTNDLGNTYNVTGLGVSAAADICFRGHTVYLVNTSQYADCRVADIQAAVDIYGACTPEVSTTANAWYACGVGGPYSPTVSATFSADITQSCSVPVTINFTNNSSNASNATWDFGDANTSTTYSPSHTYTQPGLYTVYLAVNSSCGSDSITQTSYINVNPPAAPTASNVSSCASASFNLSASGSGTIEWFATPTGGTSLQSGTTYTTPVLNTTTTYYVENDVAQAPGYVGPLDDNFGTGGMHNNTSTQYLEFTVYTNCTLLTGDVDAGSAGTKTFKLWDGAGTLIANYPVNVAATGVSTVNLNIPLTPGTYRIGGTQMNLYRNNSGASYPYSLGGAIDITGSSAGGAFYYYLYNWQIGLPACMSARTPVVCTIGALNVSFSTAAFDTVCANDGGFALSGGSPAGGTYSGPGVTAGNFDPATAGIGAHTITYTYTDSTSCTASIPATIVVDACTGISSLTNTNGISIYPNPAGNNVTVELQFASEKVQLDLVNMLGQIVYATETSTAGNTKVNINTANLPRGIYLLQVRTENGLQVRKVELQ